MWQRVQTLYFAITCGLLAALIFGRMATIVTPEGPEVVKYFSYWPFAVLLVIAALCNLVALVSFSHRAIQLRLAAVAAVVCLGLQCWLAVVYFRTGADTVYRWTLIFPFVCTVLDVLAIRGIYADELLVRSSSRLRSAKSAALRNNAKKK